MVGLPLLGAQYLSTSVDMAGWHALEWKPSGLTGDSTAYSRNIEKKIENVRKMNFVP